MIMKGCYFSQTIKDNRQQTPSFQLTVWQVALTEPHWLLHCLGGGGSQGAFNHREHQQVFTTFATGQGWREKGGGGTAGGGGGMTVGGGGGAVMTGGMGVTTVGRL